ncbi:GGDEF domain-containing protein [Cellulomonas sp. zg-ZUI188]|uniref:GGDEF domain-containing protein n=2 Tax=Cellulomonas fengjieae TaxID=2819978 RepID=A0ABS3SK81_9CELL|nr:GGDEF domain-containing protein [Cellulomonas fengjieae]MBO3102439.1 GGDEF domain-containing protein [Cellulomonas fengjieae]QVI68048.1 GGDEF domain-containing protein [Cellulomonas fengjieae]
MAAHRLDRCRSIDEVAQVAASVALEVLGARHVTFGRIQQDTLRTVVIEPAPVDPRVVWLVRASYRADDRPALRTLIRDRASWVAHARTVHDEPTAPGDPDAGDPVEVETLRELDSVSALASPVVVNGSVWGQIHAVRSRPGPPFRIDDVARAEVLAALAAGAIARVDLEAQVRHLVADDPLTGLANRRIADAEAEAALDSGYETCIVMCDVDGLKRVNDELGHDTGDDLLRSVADVLSRASAALPGSTAARIGGDEFCLVTVGRRRAEVAEVMAATIAEFPLPHGAAISYGIASTAVTGSVSARHLFRQADTAQYKAKRARARTLRAAAPAAADPAVTAERVLVAGTAAIVAAQSGVVPRLCAFAAAATETLGGSAWAVLTRRSADDPPAAVARGGSPAELGVESSTAVVIHGLWQVEVGMSATAATGEIVATSLDALAAVAVLGAR